MTYDPLLVTPAEICEAIDDAGFEGSIRAAVLAPGHVALAVTGMTCESCVASVEKVLMQLEGGGVASREAHVCVMFVICEASCVGRL